MKTRIIIATLALLVACKAPQEQVARAQSKQPTGSLDQLLAPVALYPDQLLAQILLSAGDTAKVVELDKWLKATASVKGTQLQDAALKAGFEPSYIALVPFPQVVAKMVEDLEWTMLLGQAFIVDRGAVFTTIQKLRKQAHDVGTLKTTPQQEVTTKTTSSGEDVIVIEPANPQVVYVPQYNPQVVYTQAPTTTTVVVEQNSSADAAVAAGVIGFTAGIAMGAAMNNSYYYGPYGWHGGAYMYNDAWDDYYDAREDAREDYYDHREDMMENRSDQREDLAEQRGERTETRQDQRGNTQEQRTERQENRPQSQAQGQRTGSTGQTAATRAQGGQRTTGSTQASSAQSRSTGRTGSSEARGYSTGSQTQAATQRSSDAFSGYSSGGSERSSSARGQKSRSSSASRGGGGGRRR